MNSHLKLSSTIPLDPQLLKEIISAIHEIHYGSIEIVIHDSRVVQIERKEKIRFDAESARKKK